MKIEIFTMRLDRPHLLKKEVNEFTSKSNINVISIDNHVTHGFQSGMGVFVPEIVTIVTYRDVRDGEARPSCGSLLRPVSKLANKL